MTFLEVLSLAVIPLIAFQMWRAMRADYSWAAQHHPEGRKAFVRDELRCASIILPLFICLPLMAFGLDRVSPIIVLLMLPVAFVVMLGLRYSPPVKLALARCEVAREAGRKAAAS